MHRGLRFAWLALGVALWVWVAVGDPVVIGSDSTFGRGRLLVGMLGGFVVASAVLGGRVVSLHRGTAFLLLNTVLFCLLLELGSFLSLRIGDYLQRESGWRGFARSSLENFGPIPLYDQESWSLDLWSAYADAWANLEYEPYVLWRKGSMSRETIHIDRSGFRVTPGADCKGRSPVEIFLFGGSTMWGFGAPDSGTIAAFLQERIEADLDRPVCVRNFGEGAYVSTQELIALMRRIQAGHVPRLAIFYDGWNDIISAEQTGESGSHFGRDRIARRLETGSQLSGTTESAGSANPGLVLEWLQGSYSWKLGSRLLELPVQWRRSRPNKAWPADLADQVVDTYLENLRMAEAIGEAYGFEVFGFWQPLIAQGQKPPTETERRILRYELAQRPRSRRLYRDVYSIVKRREGGSAGPHLLIDAFDEVEEQIFIDPGHVLPRGNQIIADRIFDVVRPELQHDPSAANASRLPSAPDRVPES